MDRRDLEKKLTENGFTFHRNSKHGSMYRLGGQTVSIAHTPSDTRSHLNTLKDMERIVRLVRPNDPKPEQPKQLEIKPEQKTDDMAAQNKQNKYEPKQRDEIRRVILQCRDMGKTLGETAEILHAQGFKSPAGGKINAALVGNQISHMKKAGLLSENPQIPLAKTTNLPVRSAKPELVSKISQRIPDTCMAILTDPNLSDVRKVRMILAYAEDE